MFSEENLLLLSTQSNPTMPLEVSNMSDTRNTITSKKKRKKNITSVIFVVVIQKMWAECLMKHKSCITRAGTTWSDSFYELREL